MVSHERTDQERVVADGRTRGVTVRLRQEGWSERRRAASHGPQCSLASCASSTVKVVDLHADFSDIWKGRETADTRKQTDPRPSVGVDFNTTVVPTQVTASFVPVTTDGGGGPIVPRDAGLVADGIPGVTASSRPMRTRRTRPVSRWTRIRRSRTWRETIVSRPELFKRSGAGDKESKRAFVPKGHDVNCLTPVSPGPAGPAGTPRGCSSEELHQRMNDGPARFGHP